MGYRGAFCDFAPISAPQGSIIAFATSPGQSSRENSATGHGKYTEALLRYMSLPRVAVETVFKRARQALVAETGGAQIPWEHTSLIGDFYLNPDTIYDGVSYTWDAKADNTFHFNANSDIKTIVDGLKTYNWPQQEDAINKVNFIEFEKASGNELFVLGRNIYQAACGNSFACQRFIYNFDTTTIIPDQAKLHILNGMAYEVYYNSENTLRYSYKLSYFSPIVKFLEDAQFYASKEFIASHLQKIEEKPIYIPGQNEIMYFIIKGESTTEGYLVTDIIYQGKSVFFNWDGSDKVNNDADKEKRQCFSFEQSVVESIAAPRDCVRFQYDSSIEQESFLLVPQTGFRIRFEPIE